MAMLYRPPRRNAVDDAPAVRQIQEFILRADDRQRRVGIAERGVRVPDVVAIPVCQNRDRQGARVRPLPDGHGSDRNRLPQLHQRLALRFRGQHDAGGVPRQRRPQRNDSGMRAMPHDLLHREIVGRPQQQDCLRIQMMSRESIHACSVRPIAPTVDGVTRIDGSARHWISASCNSSSFNGENGPPKVSIRRFWPPSTVGFAEAIASTDGTKCPSSRAANNGATGSVNRARGG